MHHRWRGLVVGAVLLACTTACGQGGTPGPVPGRGVPSSQPPVTPAAADPEAVPDSTAVPGPSAPVPALAPNLRPVRIVVPSVGIDSPLVDLGIAADGSIQVPTDFGRAGWLDRSPAPGQPGPAVIAGHIDSTAGPAVFFRLKDLHPGDRVMVTRADRRVVAFTVDGVQRYPKNAFPTATVYGPVPGPVLRLITCGGSFDRRTRNYRDNIVVYATEVGA